MKKTLSLALVILMLLATLLGCSSRTSTTGSTGAADSGASTGAAAPVEKTDRVLNVGLGDEPADLNPYSNVFLPDKRVRSQIYDYLVEMDKDDSVVGSLAESYEVSDDGLTYTFHIRKGVLFHNGDELKASDVKFSLDSAAASPTNQSAFVNMDHVEVVDDYTAKVIMKSGDVAFLEKLTDGYCAITSEKVFTQFGDKVGTTPESTIGTGPYVATKMVFGESIDLVANEKYWKGAPAIDAVHFTIIYDSNTAMVALQTGQIDLYMYDVPYAYMEQLKNAQDLTLTSYPSYLFYYIFFNCESGPFADVKLRQAVAHGIDREKIMTVALEGYGEITNNMGSSISTANPTSEWYSYDPAKAKQLVQEAGYDGAPIDLIYMTLDPFDKITTAMAEDLSAMGLNVTVTSMDSLAWDELCWYGGTGKFQITNMRWTYATKDLSEAMAKNVLPNSAGGNLSRWSNEGMAQLLNDAAATSDVSKRMSLYGDVQTILKDEVPLIPLFYAVSSRAYTSALTCDEAMVRYDRIYQYSWK